MKTLFRITSSEKGKLQLEATAPHTAYAETIFHAVGDMSEFMQLELDLFPLDPNEDIGFTVGQVVRLVSLAPTHETKPRRKVGVQF